MCQDTENIDFDVLDAAAEEFYESGFGSAAYERITEYRTVMKAIEEEPKIRERQLKAQREAERQVREKAEREAAEKRQRKSAEKLL